MKKLLLALTISVIGLAACARAHDKKVRLSDIPVAAQNYVKSNFSGDTIASVIYEMDDNEYTVNMADGTKMEFDAKGNVVEITNKTKGIRNSGLPAPVRKYINANYPNQKVAKVEAERNGYDVEIIHGPDLTISLDGLTARID